MADDLDTGAQIGSFQTPGHSTFFKSRIVFTPNGEHLITLSEAADESGTVVLVQRRPLRPRFVARRLSGRRPAADRAVALVRWRQSTG